MASVATMQGIWGMLETQRLSRRNKKWLADKLIMSIPAKPKKKVYSKEDQEILAGLREAARELKAIKEGRAQAQSDEDFVAEIKREI